jgi:hypothetical protein
MRNAMSLIFVSKMVKMTRLQNFESENHSSSINSSDILQKVFTLG